MTEQRSKSQADSMVAPADTAEPEPSGSTISRASGSAYLWEEAIFHIGPTEYGTTYQAHCLEMYKELLKFTEHLSARRESVNRFFLTLNTAILAAVGYFGLAGKDNTGTALVLYPLLALFGAFLSLQWARFIESHQKRFGVDFRILGLIERRLPLAVFSSEWKMLQEVEYPKRSFMRIEIRVARAFVAAYIAVLILTAGYSLASVI